VAVSGGGDSMALLHLLARCAEQTGQVIEAVTVDHGLRPEAAGEAAMVSALCGHARIPHTTLKWMGWDGKGNLSAAARDARYALMADWAKARGIGGILLGHTGDDVAETFLMRLSRKAGVDGLSAMDAQFDRNGILWARPLWQQRRDELREYLRRHDVRWIEDPTNDDLAYARVQARQALDVLAPLGIDVDTLRAVSFNMSETRAALEHYTRQEADQRDIEQAGDIVLRLMPPLPNEVERRLLSKAIQWIGSSDYPPRADAIPQIEMSLPNAAPHTIGGCLLTSETRAIRITREFNAVKDTKCPTDSIWDGRWQLSGPHAPDLEIRALGEAIRDCQNWRDSGVPRRSLMASPAVFRGDDLIAAPIAGHNPDWSARIAVNFQTFLLSH
jgi:tRNA(Ile)-lysidine synthase